MTPTDTNTDANQHPYGSIEVEKSYSNLFFKYNKVYNKRLLPLRAQGVEAYMTRSFQGISSKFLVADVTGLKFYKINRKLASGNGLPNNSKDFQWSSITLSIGIVPVKGVNSYGIVIHENGSQKASVFRLHKTKIDDYSVTDLVKVLQYWHSNFGVQVNVEQAESLGSFAHSV